MIKTILILLLVSCSSPSSSYQFRYLGEDSTEVIRSLDKGNKVVVAFGTETGGKTITIKNKDDLKICNKSLYCYFWEVSK